MELAKGTLLQGGKYIIESKLGQGGFGITYLAYQQSLKRKVAIKEFYMKDCCQRDERTATVTVPTKSNQSIVDKYKNKFISEAQRTSELSHSNIISIIDFFEENDTAYYVMPYMPCGSLAQYNNGNALPEAEALKYIRQVADALSFLHKQHKNHLDVKPGNIVLDQYKNAVLIDFGISKIYDDKGKPLTTADTLTNVGCSPGYAPLEQQNAKEQFAATYDIYALGATLYRLLTGITPPVANLLASGEEKLQPLPDTISLSTRNAVYAAMRIIKQERTQSIEEFLKILDGKASTSAISEDTTISTSTSDITTLNFDKTKTTTNTSKNINGGNSGGISGGNLQGNNADSSFDPKMSKKDWIILSVFVAIILIIIISIVKNRENKEKAEANTEYLATEEAPDVISGTLRNQEKLNFNVNGVTLTMYGIESGEFEMGSANSADESPIHKVVVSDFYMAETEVTQGLWEAVMGNNPSYHKSWDYPVEYVSWYDCQRFIENLNKFTSTQRPDGMKFRLPTEAEWEYAAMGGNGNYNLPLEEVAPEVVAVEGLETAPATNSVYDWYYNSLLIRGLGGNVCEWCLDFYDSNYYSNSDYSDPICNNETSQRVLRGECYLGYCNGSYITDRRIDDPNKRYGNVGFRVVLSGLELNVNMGTEVINAEKVKSVTSYSLAKAKYKDTWVDLGLSVYWAKCNVGESAPEYYGTYFAWGEITGKNIYTKDNSATYQKSIGDIGGDPEYDAATAIWGGGWRLPTEQEWEELKNKCKWEFTRIAENDGIPDGYGYRVKGPNGNSILLRASGRRKGELFEFVDTVGNYLSSTPHNDLTQCIGLGFNKDRRWIFHDSRSIGYSVRPVLDKEKRSGTITDV